MRHPNQTARVPVARRRRVRPRLWFLLVVALLVLIGRGFGLLGEGGEKQSARLADAGANATAPAPGSSGERSLPSGSTAPAPGGEPRQSPGAAPAGELIAPPRTEPKRTPGAGVERDRFASLLSLVSTRTEAGELGNAIAAQRSLGSLPLDAAQLASFDAATRQLETALAAACNEVAQGIAQGQVLEAREAMRRLLPDAEPNVHPVLAESLRRLGLGEGLLRVPVQTGRPWPVPAPLPRDRNVRVRVGALFQLARVIDSSSDQVTLRVSGEQGVTFPTMPAVVCEPVDPTAAEATEMGFAALHAGDALLARMWLAAASLRSKEARTVRAEQLAELLR
ncbi:MAG TPA: hypothetical protein VFT55_12785 [Planctomycetota bacterium]|nr:hypothetical protein [Planctomycetota bacterium]